MDPKKAEANIRKHGVSFLIAATVLRDPLSITAFDEAHSEAEERWITIGLAANGQCMLVVHTWAEINETSPGRALFPRAKRRTLNG
jgi:uncharacterized DUF497 family protein